MSIYEHPLVWRWNDEKHSVLSESVLRQMKALEALEAEKHFQSLVSLIANGMLSDQKFEKVTKFSADQSLEVVSSWLRQQNTDPAQEVAVLWGADVGIQSNWEVFTSYWDSFCYPFDRVLISPPSLEWTLFYHPEEEFQFGIGPRY